MHFVSREGFAVLIAACSFSSIAGAYDNERRDGNWWDDDPGHSRHAQGRTQLGDRPFLHLEGKDEGCIKKKLEQRESGPVYKNDI